MLCTFKLSFSLSRTEQFYEIFHIVWFCVLLFLYDILNLWTFGFNSSKGKDYYYYHDTELCSKMILFWVNWNWPYKVNFLSLVFQDARHLSQGKKSISFQWLCKIWSSFFDNMVVLDLWKYHFLLNHKSVIFHHLSYVSNCNLALNSNTYLCWF